MSPEPDRHITRTGDDYAEAMQALLPQGQAWPRHHGSVLMKLVRGISQIWGNFELKASRLLEIESDPRLTQDGVLADGRHEGLLLDWERNWGLPDQCYATPQSVELRQYALVRRMTIEGAQSREFFIGLAYEIGYTITISEYRPFFIAMDGCGDCRVTGAPYPKGDIATFNPADKAPEIVLSNGNMTCGTTRHNWARVVRSNIGHGTGKRYFEMRMDARTDYDYIGFGIAAADFPLNESTADAPIGNWLGGWPTSVGVWDTGFITQSHYDPAFPDSYNYTEYQTHRLFEVGQWIGIAVDLDAGNFWANTGAGWSDCSYNLNDRHPAIYFLNSRLSVASETVGTSAAPYTTQSARGIVGHSSGKHYVEFKMDARAGAEDIGFGVGEKTHPLDGWLGWEPAGWSVGFYDSGVLHHNDTTDLGLPFALGEWVGFAVDLDAGKGWIRNAAGWYGDPEAGTGEAFTIPPGITIHAITQLYGAGDGATTNFGASAFAYPVPEGFDGWIGRDILKAPDIRFGPGVPYFAAANLFDLPDIVTVNFGATAFAGTPPPGFIAWEDHDPMRNDWHQPIMDARGDTYVLPGQLSAWPNYGIGGVPYVNGEPVDASQAQGPTTRYYWTVYVADAGLQWFRCASGQCGIDPHLIVDIAEDLECLLERWKPAHTDIIFDYSGLQKGGEFAGTP